MLKMKLDRPIAFFDIEATGTSPRADRIVELCLIKIQPGGERITRVYRANPQRRIPLEVQAIHGISDADVADCPPFSEYAPDVAAFIDGCDLAGYNVLRYDIPMLQEEMGRASVAFSPDDYRVVDVQRIFHQREPRDLSAALRFYGDEEHVDAHGAQPDVDATIKVLGGQFKRYGDLPATVEALAQYCDPKHPDWVDRAGRMKWVNREVTLNFGKKSGTPLRHAIENDPGFINWMLRSDFPPDTREIVSQAMAGNWPAPPPINQLAL